MSTLLLRVFVYVCSLASGALALPLAVAIRDGDAVSGSWGWADAAHTVAAPFPAKTPPKSIALPLTPPGI